MNEVKNIDCLEAMYLMEDGEIDLAIVDPPYGIGDTWSKSRSDTFYHKGKMHAYKNSDIPPGAYFEQLFRVSKNQIIWGGNYFTDHLPPTNAWIIWDKEKSHNAWMSHAEVAWTSFKKVMQIYRHPWDGGRKGQETGTEKIHPHQKPINLYRWCLANYAENGHKIMDTHVGSGSSRIACHMMGFEFIGFEIDEGYYQAQEKRFKESKLQTKIEEFS